MTLAYRDAGRAVSLAARNYSGDELAATIPKLSAAISGYEAAGTRFGELAASYRFDCRSY